MNLFATYRISLILILGSICYCDGKKSSLFKGYAKPNKPLFTSSKDVGEPLFITPYLEDGNIKEARNLSRVQLPGDCHNTISFSGYLTVDKQFHSNMFFWFFPAKEASEAAPLVIWLQGGPGGSSLFGLFTENGPFNVDKNMNLVYRQYSWTDSLNVLYFDNPVGTGFSFTASDEGYARDEVAVGRNLYSATQQFLTLFPELRPNDLFITGESYAGKYVPALAYTIHKENPTAQRKINLKGMAIGDGLCDPYTMTDYGTFLYGIGLLDATQRDEFMKRQAVIKKDIEQQKWMEAFNGFDSILNGDTTDVPSLFSNYTGLTFYYNYNMDSEPEDMGHFTQYVNIPEVRKAIHVGDKVFNDGVAVEQHLAKDVMQSVKPWIEEILNEPKYRVMIYSGQLDIIIAHPLTRAFVDSLDWSGAAEFKKADKYIWKVNGLVAGYVKETSNFVEVLVRGAGHMVPYDQPQNAYDMITKFTMFDRFTE